VRVMQNWGMKKAEPKTPHFLSLNQDIVAGSQREKCGLKYVIHSPESQRSCLPGPAAAPCYTASSKMYQITPVRPGPSKQDLVLAIQWSAPRIHDSR
jgi:hypothetical protein